MNNNPQEKIKFSDLAQFTPRQKAAMQSLKTHKFVLYGGAMGGGKLLSTSTVIPTPSGWSTMGDLQVGDQVFDEQGAFCNVNWVSDVQYETTYKITFSDGSEIVAGARHQWVTETNKDMQAMLRRSPEFRERRRLTRASRSKGKRPDVALRNADVAKNYVSEPIVPTVKTTQEIKDTLYKGSQVNHAIRVCGPLQLPEAELLIPPYTLGAWLGDGTAESGGITGIDPEIFEEIERDGFEVTHHRNKESHCIIGIIGLLRKIGVYGNKHIPAEYLRASINQRLSLLQGLMDTDGYCDRRGQCEITLTRKELVDGVKELILSLGIKVVACESRSMLNGVDCGPRWRMKFITNLPVFRLDRKMSRQKVSGFRGTHERRYIVNVEETDQVPLKCIGVDSLSHLYLCGENMIPTHNSFFLRWYAVRFLMELFLHRGIKWATVMLACEDYPSLKDRQIQKIGREFPDWLGKGHSDHKDYGRCFILSPEYGNGVIVFRNLDDPSKYKSSEFAAILVDELTRNQYDVFNDLRTRLRWPGLHDTECKFVGGTNPGDIGHGWVKQLWMDKLFPEEFIRPIDYRPLFDYVPSKASDNPHLDPSYWNMLNTLPTMLRKAFADGDWSIFVGQAFPELSAETHCIPDVPVPSNAPLYMTYDWGYGKPFSIGWWWVDADERIYRFASWYGYNGNHDEGLRMADSLVKQGVIDREKSLGIWGRDITRLSGPDCFAKKPDYRGGGQGPSTAEVFSSSPDPLYLTPGDPDRKLKIRQFRERLLVPEDGTMPMLVVYKSAWEHFYRTISALPTDKNNPEDIDTKAEDHVFDEVCFLVQARPIGPSPIRVPKLPSDARIDLLEEGTHNTYDDQEWEYIRQDRERMYRMYDDRRLFGDWEDNYDGLYVNNYDGLYVNTVE